MYEVQSLFGVLLLGVLAEGVRQALTRAFQLYSLPAAIPWAGASSFSLGKIGATLASVFQTPRLSEDGYYKFAKKNQPFVLPCLFTGPEVILPSSQLRWLLTQPEDKLSQRKAGATFFETGHTLFAPTQTVLDTVRVNVIRRDLSKQLPTIFSELVDELDCAFGHAWGADRDGWTELPLHNVMKNLVCQVHLRAYVGKPLCRDRRFVYHCTRFLRFFALTAAIISLVPRRLKPYLAPLIASFDRWHFRKASSFITPIVKERMALFEQGGGNTKATQQERNDAIQWTVREAYQNWDKSEWNPEMMVKRVIPFIVVTFQVTTVAITNTLFDLASLPNAATVFADIEKEVGEVLVSDHGFFTLDGLSRMPLIDSCIRESLRFNGGATGRGPAKEVIAPEGVILPNGVHVPQGTKIGVSAYSIHHDDDVYHDANVFDPYRFAKTGRRSLEGRRLSIASSKASSDNKNSGKTGAEFLGEDNGMTRKLNLVTTSDTFMGFGHGRWACPGRFYAATKMKLLLAYIVMNYDIEPLKKRPENMWFGNNTAPPFDAVLRVRRKGRNDATT